MVQVWNGDDCSTQLLTFAESVPGMAAKGFLSAAESSGDAVFCMFVLVAVALSKRRTVYSC